MEFCLNATISASGCSVFQQAERVRHVYLPETVVVCGYSHHRNLESYMTSLGPNILDSLPFNKIEVARTQLYLDETNEPLPLDRSIDLRPLGILHYCIAICEDFDQPIYLFPTTLEGFLGIRNLCLRGDIHMFPSLSDCKFLFPQIETIVLQFGKFDLLSEDIAGPLVTSARAVGRALGAGTRQRLKVTFDFEGDIILCSVDAVCQNYVSATQLYAALQLCGQNFRMKLFTLCLFSSIQGSLSLSYQVKLLYKMSCRF